MLRFLLMSMMVTLAMLSCACSSGGKKSTPVINVTVSSGADTFKVLDVATGVIADQDESYDPTAAAAGEIVFRRVDPGTALLGTLSTSDDFQADETRAWFSITSTQYVAVTELTQGQYQALVSLAGGVADPWTALSPSAAFGGGLAVGADYPAYGLDKDNLDILLADYNALGRTEGLRLPTGNEWEYCARAGATTRYSWGDEEDAATVGLHAAVRGTAAGTGPEQVAQRQANALGFHDCHGNCWEWVSDQATATGPALRGGDWYSHAGAARAANRQHIPSDLAYGNASVRLVLVLP